MVRRVLGIVYKEVRGLHQAAYVLALFAFGSQLLALLRDRLLAHQFGAGTDLDIYYAAFRLPDLLFVLFASSLSVYVLIPFISRAKKEGGTQAGSLILSQVFTIFLLAYALFALVAFITAPKLLPWFFPGIVDQEMLTLVTRVLLVQPFLLGLSSLFGVVTQLGHRFILYAVSPLIYNLGIIFGIVALYPLLGLPGLALGVVLGALGHLLVQWPFVYRSGFKINYNWRFDWPELGRIFRLSIPRALTLSMQQIVMLVLLGMASVMAVGSVSVFQLAFNLQSVPLAVIGVSYSVAAFPVLAELYAKREHNKFAAHIITALRHIIFWSVPAIALIIVLRAQVVRVVLGSGQFDWADTRLTAAVLALFSLSLLAQAIILVVVRAFYAGGQTRLPLYVTSVGSFLAIISAFGFYYLYMAHTEVHALVSSLARLSDVAGSEVLTLALGYSLAVILQAVVLVWLAGRMLDVPLRWLVRSVTVASASAVVGGLFAYGTLNFVVVGINQETFLGIFVQGLTAGAAGIVGIILTYAYFKSPELHEIAISFHKRLFKVDVVAPEENIL